eukprot:TRINITY_DN8500_c0_g1_i3.p1 TRINITY_DN8500_c0_g1~~TRINITY_DN8500_c0_g1_i3.p1  ORF type:complete len:2086 (-),score=492.32 TRINITY_DN8500_c0_g1_i3:221-6478(-)
MPMDAAGKSPLLQTPTRPRDLEVPSSPAAASTGGASSARNGANGSHHQSQPADASFAVEHVQPRLGERAAPPQGRSAQHARHLGALLKKNGVLKRREWSATCCPMCPFAACCELLLPIGVLALLWWAKDQCDSGGQCKVPILAGWGGNMPAAGSNYSIECKEGLPLDPPAATPFGPSKTPSSLEGIGYSKCKAWSDVYRRPIMFLDVLAYLHWTGDRLALAVEDPSDKPKVEKMRDYISTHWHPEMEMNNIPCVDLERQLFGKGIRRMEHKNTGSRMEDVCESYAPNPGTLPNFSALTYPEVLSASELDSYLDSKDYGDGDNGHLYGAVVFKSVGGDGSLGAPGAWDYSIRLNASVETSPITNLPKTRPLDPRLLVSEAWMYTDRGFLSLQLLINRYIIGVKSGDSDAMSLLEKNGLATIDGHNGDPAGQTQHHTTFNETDEVIEQLAEPLRYFPQALEASPFPIGGVLLDGFYELVKMVFPLVFIVAFLYTQKKVVNELIIEKETKVRESLRMLGVGSLSIIGSWYATYACIFAGLCFIFAVVAAWHVFPLSNVSLIFLFFWLWCMSFLAFAFFMHTFFSNARTGGIVTVLAMFLQWLLYATATKDGPASESLTVILMIMPNAAFCNGLDMLAMYEGVKVGANWSELFMEVNNSSLGEAMMMMTLDVFLWTLAGWYLDRILPKEFGVRMPPYFIFLSSYWCPKRQEALRAQDPAANGSVNVHAPPAVCKLRESVEPVPEADRTRSMATGRILQIQGLRREFSTPGGLKVAVAGLDMTMYEGQIVALLGHNGAGKTTTINMLTGMLAPSAGDAVVAGHRLSTELDQIRRIIGVCPQHDVLWLELTVAEHLRTYSRLRGVSAEEERVVREDLMVQVGLGEKLNTRAGSLSGGQKRKLSMCLAMMGHPPVLYLDEPTSGMDPFSRRATWGIIRNIREGRVTVLTTHFMDEADVLADRIAIMSEGELQCCGSSLFLKSRFGTGYRLTCARAQGAAADGGPEQHSHSEDIVLLIRRHVADAELLVDIGAELSMRLPTAAAGRFAALFEDLDRQLPKLGLVSYGLSMVTLEEVFLSVASGRMEETAEEGGDESPQEAAAAALEGENGRQRGLTEISLEDMAVDPEAVVPTRVDVRTLQDANDQRQGQARVTLRHVGALFMKRARYARRDFKSVACIMLLPVAWLAFGLWLLKHFTGQHLPEMGFNLYDQYGRSVEFPFNITRNASENNPKFPNSLSGEYDADPQAQDVDLQRATGVEFGRTYESGLPSYVPCESTVTKLPPSKCFREETFCKKQAMDMLNMARAAGVNIGCHSTPADCLSETKRLCSDDMWDCIFACQSEGVPFGACKANCKSICHLAPNITKACTQMNKFFPGATVAFACPVQCANTTNPQTCAPGSACSAPPNPHAGDAAALLGLHMKLFEEGATIPRQRIRYGAALISENASVGTTLSIMFNTSSPHSLPTYFSVVSSAFKRAFSGPDSYIASSNHPMPRISAEALQKIISTAVNLFSTFVIIEAFSFIPAAVVAYVVRERESHHNSKHQQLISGVGIISYWTSNLLWDFAVFLVPLSLSLLFIWLFDINAFLDDGALQATFVIFLGYGMSIMPFSYLLSFAFGSHTTAQVVALVFNFATGLILMIVSFILSNIEATRDVNSKLEWIFRLFPGFSLGNGLFQICKGSALASIGAGFLDKPDFLSWDYAGREVVNLYCTAPVYFALVLLYEYLRNSPLAAASRYFDAQAQEDAEEEDVGVDEDVKAEEERMTTGAAATDVIRLEKLRKVYRTPEGIPKVAVHRLSFGIPSGECFGFLGINGAGKTTTLNMLTGAVLPSGGKAYLANNEIVEKQWQVRRLLGYCPQHDALLDRLTVREHLVLFGRIKGIPLTLLQQYCDRMMKELSLAPHVDKMAMTLSGGNKRKLSLAIALMNSPPLVMLDEPSTGVDPAARRLMWDVISTVSTGPRASSVMLTTHNMEEAEALCTRIGIMVGGKLRCLGSNQHLKARFGGGYQLEARLRCPSAEEISQAAQRWNLGGTVERSHISAICDKLGEPRRAAWIAEGSPEANAIFHLSARYAPNALLGSSLLGFRRCCLLP